MKNQRFYLAVTLILSCSNISKAQTVKDFFYIENNNKELPVFVRGNLDNKIILLFVQGGPGETAIDFGRSDYPRWQNTLEKKVAIAYYDQRGLNQKVNRIDTTLINYKQYSKDIFEISKQLKEKYQAKIYLMGHSYGGGFVYHCLSEFNNTTIQIEGGIVLNTPITTDYSSERYNYYRPLYLKNLALEFIDKDIDTQKWKEAYDWIEKIDAIHAPEDSKKWNSYVDSAFESTKRKTSAKMASRVLFSKPYNPIKYLNNKDNKLVSDLIWHDQKNINFFECLPKINHPVLIITGRFDDLAGPEEMQKAGELLKNLKVIILPNAGHESYLDQPKLFNKAILQFVLRK
jgi:pimeloyl-ACP methyl ester carboxylesterase